MAHVASAALWRVLYPARRERYLEKEAPVPLERLYYTATDGWRAPLFRVPRHPGGAGEPVLLLHPLGMAGDGYRYGAQTLAGTLARAGFSVYLLAHRGDRSAIPPEGAALGYSFDDILAYDLPAALERVCADACYPAAHLVGHGLGGQLALAWAARRGAQIASVVAVGAAAAFGPSTRPKPASGMRSVLRLQERVHGLIGVGGAVPIRALGRLLHPMVDAEADWIGALTNGHAVSARLRGVLRYACEDIPLPLLRQVATWMRLGHLTSSDGHLDYTEAMVDATVPLYVIAGSDDHVCAPDAAMAAVRAWGHSDATSSILDGYGHIDLLLGERAHTEVFSPIRSWLEERRRRAWGTEGRSVPCTVVSPCVSREP